MDRVVIALAAAAGICAVTAVVVPVDAALEPDDIFVSQPPGPIIDPSQEIDVTVGDLRVFVAPPPGYQIGGWGSDDDGANVTLVAMDRRDVITVNITNGLVPSGDEVGVRDGRPIVQLFEGQLAWAPEEGTLITVSSMSGIVSLAELLRALEGIEVAGA